MTDTPSRMFSLVCILILLWVGVYWLHEPRPSTRITFDAASPAGVNPALPTSDPSTTDALTYNAPGTPPSPTTSPPQPDQARPTASVTAPTETQPPRPRVVPPRFRQYTVEKGDVSFETIAQKLFGDRRKWTVIARANPWVTPDRLRPGRTVLNIPLEPDNIQGKVIIEGGDPSAPAQPPEPGDSVPTTYVVQKDDTLWGIAKKVYGRGADWRVIYEANRKVIRDPDRPPAGATLTIPPAPRNRHASPGDPA